MRSRGKAWYGEEKQESYTPLVSDDPSEKVDSVPVPSNDKVKRLPKLEGVDVQIMQVKQSIGNKFTLLGAYMALQSITHQRPATIFARRDSAAIGLRKGMPIGCKVSLEGEDMHMFIDKLTDMVLPRLKEYYGFKPRSGDGHGNFNLCIPASAMALFPDIEVCFEKYPRTMELHVNIRTSCQTNEEGALLLSGFQIPFQSQSGVIVPTRK
jgi:large subunit ribosomal protein L5